MISLMHQKACSLIIFRLKETNVFADENQGEEAYVTDTRSAQQT